MYIIVWVHSRGRCGLAREPGAGCRSRVGSPGAALTCCELDPQKPYGCNIIINLAVASGCRFLYIIIIMFGCNIRNSGRLS